MRKLKLVVAHCLLTVSVQVQAESPDALKLWYKQPASKWTQALPIGNGRLGAMIYGGIQQEQLQINEDTLWTGGPHDYSNPEAYSHLAKVRQLLEKGEYDKAEAEAGKMMGKPIKQMAYQPLGDLFLKFPQGEKASDYRRELDLQTAVSTVSYRRGSARFTRKVFASEPDQAIVVRLECDRPGCITFDLLMTSPHPSQSQTTAEATLLMTGQVAPRKPSKLSGARGLIGPWEGEGMKFAAQVKVAAQGGTVMAQGDRISVRDADTVTLVYVAATNFVNYQDLGADPVARVTDTLAAVGNKSFDQLYQRHVEDYASLFGRVAIDLGGQGASDFPTDERFQRAADGAVDPLLAEQVFQYGRYLMIAGSRPGSQPLNLQGIWNDDLDPSWCSKYTININIQMNYWVSEVCNLSECHEPFLRMASELVAPGRKTAKTHYRADGWMTHHNTDLWRGTAPVDGAHWGMWPSGGAWLCQHLWEHYLYTGDMAYLRKAYPIMKGAAEFFLSEGVLVQDKDGTLITSPSISPEHSHGGGSKDGLSSNRSGAAVCAGPTMDGQILRDLFANCIVAAEILDIDEDFRTQVAQTRARLAPMKVGRHGQLQEWQEDWDNPNKPHSHVSHLYGLYPSAQINRFDTPKLFDAARTSLIQRGDAGGWPGAWRISLWARAGDGDRAYKNLNNVMRRLVGNLFNGERFQIDANFGAAAGIAEMLLQSHGGEIHLLPALPKVWPDGSVKGLRARGGFTVDIEWKDGQLVKATINADRDGTFRLRAQGKPAGSLSLKQGESKIWSGIAQDKDLSWEALSEQYEVPQWFTDARFGVWVHWGAQTVPEFGGGWYARHMYMQDVGRERFGRNAYPYHLKTFGHPSEVGFKEVIHAWKAENLNTDGLLKYFTEDLGARYFMALAHHHDNFDNWDSTYQEWNSVNVGPKRDIIGEFSKSAKKYGVPFGVTTHDERFFDWNLPAFGADTSGEFKDVPYDGRLTKEDGIGKWWEGLDPANLYGLPPEKRTPEWAESWKHNWLLRMQELLTQYDVDYLWFDGRGFPYGEYGKEAFRTFYNHSLSKHGKINAVIAGKIPGRDPGILHDIEQGVESSISPVPWQSICTYTHWFYKKDDESRHDARSTIQLMIDVASKNGNFVLNVELLPDGTIPPDHKVILDQFGAWLKLNGEAIYATSPWKVHGDNLLSRLADSDSNNANAANTDLAASQRRRSRQFNNRTKDSPAYGHEEVRFTIKEDALYVCVLNPAEGEIELPSLGLNSMYKPKQIQSIRLIGSDEDIKFSQSDDKLSLDVPAKRPNPYAAVFEVKGSL